MIYDREYSRIHLYEEDIRILNACGMDMDQVMKAMPNNCMIPPLWSVLSYALLLFCTYPDTFFWQDYRELENLIGCADAHYTPAQLRKNGSSGVRTLHIPDEDIRRHQRFILREILRHLPVSDHAYAYRKGRSIRDCAAPHVQQQMLIHMDIRNFFSSIRRQMVFEALCKATGYPKSVADFLSRMCCYRGALPQGACTSPVLSNVCFLECDEALAAFAKSHDLVYTRYSDDLFFSGDSQNAAPVIAGITDILASFGFSVNKDKTKVLRQHNAQKILGLIVNSRMQVTREYRRKLRQELHYVHKFQEDARDAADAEAFLSYLHQLQGRIAFVLSADPTNAAFLEEKRRLSALIADYENRCILRLGEEPYFRTIPRDLISYT